MAGCRCSRCAEAAREYRRGLPGKREYWEARSRADRSARLRDALFAAELHDHAWVYIPGEGMRRIDLPPMEER